LIIDIIPKRGCTLDDIKERWAKAVIVKTPTMNVLYTNYDKWYRRERPLPKVFA
jgi:hypothetical protein